MTQLDSFLITTGRTLAQLQLYTAEHPAVKEALREARRQLDEALASSSEIVLGLHENRLVVNGQPVSGSAEAASRPFLLLFAHLGIHSLTFLSGAGEQDLAAFFSLAFEAAPKKTKPDPAAYLAARGVSRIQVNLAKYAKIGEDEPVGREGGEAASGEQELMAQLREMSLEKKA